MYFDFFNSIIINLPSHKRARRFIAKQRLVNLDEYLFTRQTKNEDPIDWEQSSYLLSCFNDRLGRAGYIFPQERRRAIFIKLILVIGFSLLGITLALQTPSFLSAILGLGVGVYTGFLSWIFYLKWRTANFEREIMFQLPLSLESLILLVESGLGILPALEKMVSNENKVTSNQNPVNRVFKIVYDLTSHGMEFSRAIEVVAEAIHINALKHVLLHLDLSGSEGAELIPSLRGLSNHAHLEWKLNVEHRVRKLENLVVFPVFISVIGLMLLTAAVPMVPLLDLKDKLNVNKPLRQEQFSANHL
jgi:Flp pilus assembly protein TadB